MEFLPKQSSAVEQLVAFLKQGLIEAGDWFSVEDEPGVRVDPKKQITADDMKKILMNQLDENDTPVFVDDSLKVGFLGSLMIAKIFGESEPILTSVSALPDGSGIEKVFSDYWGLKLGLVRQEDYFPDPSGRKLYEIERLNVDWYQLMKMAKRFPDLFNMEAIKNLRTGDDSIQQFEKSRETDQNQTYANMGRRVIVLYELWGTILEPSTGEVLHENCQMIVAEDMTVVMPPRPNANWSQESPYVASPITRVPFSVWHKALMDAPTLHNRALNEIYNLMFDSGMAAVHGIKQVRTDWLMDPSQVANGITAGATLEVNSTAPVGAKVIENVYTGTPNTEALSMYNITDQEFNSSALTNDTRLGGIPGKSVKATEIVSSNQSINTIFNGITKAIEDKYMKEILRKGWLQCAQNISKMNPAVLERILGPERAMLIGQMSSAQVFADTALGKRFKVFGLSTTLNKINDFRKLTALLQTIGTSPQMMAAFEREYSMTKFFGQIVKSLDINEDKIKASPEELQAAAAREQMMVQEQQAGIAKKAGSNKQSQIPQASASNSPEGGPQVPRADLMRGDGTGAPI